ncbi:MAG: tyrosine-type recombinase/integrase [Verrucomicrobia bacterium]|nr:tyrosine-type recombinase/integrase [Verrucomicrobiota bacterium]
MLSRTVTFSTLRDELLAAKRADRKSKQYLTDLSHRLATFSRDFGERQVAGIETREIDDWLRGLKQSPISRLNFRKVRCTTFAFAVSRGYARENPVLKTARVKIDHATPGILRPAEIAELLAAADPKIVPALALAAFAGLRDAEVGRMTWDRLDLVGGYAKVDAAIAKTSSRRLIPVSTNLRAWLAPFAQSEGKVRGAKRTLDPLYRDARAKAAAILEKARQPARGLLDWPHNALRHSFVSYRMALVANSAQV